MALNKTNGIFGCRFFSRTISILLRIVHKQWVRTMSPRPKGWPIHRKGLAP